MFDSSDSSTSWELNSSAPSFHYFQYSPSHNARPVEEAVLSSHASHDTLDGFFHGAAMERNNISGVSLSQPYSSEGDRVYSSDAAFSSPRQSAPSLHFYPTPLVPRRDSSPYEGSKVFSSPHAVSVKSLGPPPPPARQKQSSSRGKASNDPNHLLKITRKAVADETLAVLRKGKYTLPDGNEIDVAESLKNALAKATSFSPDYYFVEEVEPRFSQMVVEVTDETTIQACKRLHDETGRDVGCLAFSSGKNPGGGFLGGSGGQEESIARSSAYYLCVIKDPTLYEYNRSHKDPYHSDHMIVSPEVPVIRDERSPYQLKDPWLLTVISAPAVNAGVVRSRNPNSEAEIHRRMRNRIRRILGAAVEHGVSRLILGEYGCGALENNPRDVARYFKEELLVPNAPFACAFDRVVFAVHDDIGNHSCGRQRTPCLPEFAYEICPVGASLVITREMSK